MGKIDNAVAWIKNIAADNSHGYSQVNRWGNPDYDCSSLVISAWEQAGVKIKTGGATYTGDMRNVMLRNGFIDVTGSVNRNNGANMQAGDVLLNTQKHVAMYIGNGRIVEARSDETHGIRGAIGGDQDGHEIGEGAYYNFPWDYILRYNEPKVTAPTENKQFCGKGIGAGKVRLTEMVHGYNGVDELGICPAGSGVEILEINRADGRAKVVWPGCSKGYGFLTKTNMYTTMYPANKKIPNTNLCGAGNWTAIATTQVNVRDGASESSHSYGLLQPGQAVEVLEQRPDGWMMIVWPGSLSGYAYTAMRYYKIQ